MDDFDFDGYDDFSVYNDDPVHNMYVDDFYNAGNSNMDYVDDPGDAVPEEDDAPTIDISAVPPHLRPFVDEYGNLDMQGLFEYCLHKCGFYDDEEDEEAEDEDEDE